MTGATVERALGQRFQRVLGVYDQGLPGPTMVCLGGIHGNEPAGVHALLAVLASLRERKVALRGRFVALAGNLGALNRNERFLYRDLNRAWQARDIEEMRRRDPALDQPEDAEQRELVAEFTRFAATAQGPLVFVDLHSSSSKGPSFSCLADTLPNRKLAFALPVPTILGLEECIDGAVMQYFESMQATRRVIALAVEGGQHLDPQTFANLEAAVWLSLNAAGLMRADKDELERHRQTMRRSAPGMPGVVEVIHRQEICAEDRFVMAPGFASFDRIHKGQLLARDLRGEVLAPKDCLMLLPLYQGQGDDGFFLMREVKPFWLWLSAILRRLAVYRIVHWLPGVRRAPEDPDTLITDQNVARWRRVDIFHLLGFRKHRIVGNQQRFTRRRAWE